MTTNRDIVNLFKVQIKEINGDWYASDRAILAELLSVRNLLIKREIDKRKLKDVDSLYTTIPCLEMIEVPLAECCSYRAPCNIRRSKYPLPKVGESIWGYIIEGIWSIDGKVTFDKGTAQKYATLLDLLDKNPNIYWIQNNYLYISDPDIETVKARLFLEDLEMDLKLFSCSEEFEKMLCMNPLDDKFRCPGYLIQNIMEISVKKYLSFTRAIPNDQTDNDTQIPN